jgi:hypothetical protein
MINPSFMLPFPQWKGQWCTKISQHIGQIIIIIVKVKIKGRLLAYALATSSSRPTWFKLYAFTSNVTPI